MQSQRMKKKIKKVGSLKNWGHTKKLHVHFVVPDGICSVSISKKLQLVSLQNIVFLEALKFTPLKNYIDFHDYSQK